MTWSKTGAFLYGQELAVEGVRHLLAQRFPIFCLTTPLLQQLHGADDIGCRDECSVRLTGRVLRVDKLQTLRGYAPVAILVLGDDAILQVFIHQVL